MKLLRPSELKDAWFDLCDVKVCTIFGYDIDVGKLWAVLWGVITSLIFGYIHHWSWWGFAYGALGYAFTIMALDLIFL